MSNNTFSKELKKHLDLIHTLHYAALHTGDEASVHDLRVSIRRLLPYLELIALIRPDLKNALQLQRSHAREFMKELNRMRDIQANQVNLREYFPDQDMNALIESLQRLERNESKQLRTALADPLLSHLLAYLDGIIDGFSIKGKAISKAMPKITEKRFNRALSALEAASTASLGDFHTVRIALKKLRYNLELYASLHGEPQETMDIIHELKGYQDSYGKLQDLIALLKLLGASPEMSPYVNIINDKIIAQAHALEDSRPDLSLWLQTKKDKVLDK